MTDSAANAATTPAADTVVTELPAGKARARIITSENRMQVLVNGRWYDVEGVVQAALYTADPRYTGRVTFSKIEVIASFPAKGGPPAGAALPPASIVNSSRTGAPESTTSQGTVTLRPDLAEAPAAPAGAAKPAA
jgi:hypothetical protein